MLWVKGSGGDLGSIQRQGFASLYLSKLHALRQRYRGPALEDEMVELYSLCTFGQNPVATSIDTPLHGFLPFAHVDHLHPDWGIALAAAANGPEVLADFNERFGHRLIWLPWKRPGFELAMRMRHAVEAATGCDGIVLAGHGLFTWGSTSRECYRRSLGVIDHLGQLVLARVEKKGSALFGGARAAAVPERRALVTELLPFVRGRVSEKSRQIAHYSDARGAALRPLARRGGAGAAWHELSGSLHSHQDSPAVRGLAAGRGAGGAATALRGGTAEVSRGVSRLLPGPRPAGLASAARR